MTGEPQEPTLASLEPSDARVSEAPGRLSDIDAQINRHDTADIGNQRSPVSKMSGAGYDVVVDVDEEVSSRSSNLSRSVEIRRYLRDTEMPHIAQLSRFLLKGSD